MLVYLNFRKILSSLNYTYLTLIPKVKCPVKVSDFKHIALCNVLYKIISKMLTNRLKIFVPIIIFELQSAFQIEKAISDNILVTFETLHHMNIKKTRKMGFMDMKYE